MAEFNAEQMGVVNTPQITVHSFADGSLLAQRPLADNQTLLNRLAAAVKGQQHWQTLSVQQRAVYCRQAIAHLVANKQQIAHELSCQMGRPIRYAEGEINGLAERGYHMIDIAEQQLADIVIAEPESLTDNHHFTRFIRRVPLGVVVVIAPWNYPYLTAVNAIIPALMAGNAVLLKHSAQTPLCAERFFEAFAAANLPSGVFNYCHIDHAQTATLIRQPQVNFVSFTGSVAGGAAIELATAGLFKGVALELGGKDPAYVRADADLNHAIEQVVDGAFFNSGQSCCGIERVYVHQSLYPAFVAGVVALVKTYQLGNPLDPQTTLGPMINAKAAAYVREQINQAVAAGATAHINPALFAADKPGTAYLAPQVLTDVDHSMAVMKDESFGPVIGIMAVADDQQAINLMNDSPYGLTASIWTKDQQAAIDIGNQLDTGTVFMNRCDYLDPALAWVGVKQSGRGCALSALGYQQLTRPKSFHLKAGQ